MRQRDARPARQKVFFFRSGDNSPSSGHLTHKSLLCQIYCFYYSAIHNNFKGHDKLFPKKQKKYAVWASYRIFSHPMISTLICSPVRWATDLIMVRISLAIRP